MRITSSGVIKMVTRMNGHCEEGRGGETWMSQATEGEECDLERNLGKIV
jgi:hypothetical protein